MNNIFTIDTEDWFHANYEDGLFQNDSTVKSTVVKNTEVYLEALKRNHSTATFFVLGFVAEQHPDLIKRISADGHEIASHGYAHQLVYRQTPDEFREDVHRSKCMLEDLVGKEVIGYRAPSWSITEDSLWALSILEEEGFLYDSSIFPFKNFLYGISGAPRFPFRACRYNEQAGSLIEIPPSTIRIPGMNIPFSGGFYFRVLPYMLIDRCTRKGNRDGHSVIFYLHPREIDPKQPRLKLNKRDALIHYYGIGQCEHKLNKILEKFPCKSIQQTIEKGLLLRGN